LESDRHRQGQYARAAADTAAEVAMDAKASPQDREDAGKILQSSLTVVAWSLLQEAQKALADARGETDP
jgi:hypothetical protein